MHVDDAYIDQDLTAPCSHMLVKHMGGKLYNSALKCVKHKQGGAMIVGSSIVQHLNTLNTSKEGQATTVGYKETNQIYMRAR